MSDRAIGTITELWAVDGRSIAIRLNPGEVISPGDHLGFQASPHTVERVTARVDAVTSELNLDTLVRLSSMPATICFGDTVLAVSSAALEHHALQLAAANYRVGHAEGRLKLAQEALIKVSVQLRKLETLVSHIRTNESLSAETIARIAELIESNPNEWQNDPAIDWTGIYGAPKPH